MEKKLSPAEALRKNRNNNGRPTISETKQKNCMVYVRFNIEEYTDLNTNARRAKMSVSQFIRTAVKSCQIKERLSAIHLKLIRELTGMANNLNQIARQANAGGYLSAKTESENLTKSIDNLINKIENDG